VNAYLDANAEGLGLLLIFGLIAIVVLLIALVCEKVERTRHMRIDAEIDYARCERAGSQREIARRIRTAVGR
jgi:hypothetical protein